MLWYISQIERETLLVFSDPQIKYKSQTLYHELPGAGLPNAVKEMGGKMSETMLYVSSSVVQAFFFKKKILICLYFR